METAQAQAHDYGRRDDQAMVTEFVLQRAGAPRVTVLDHGASINSVRLDADDPATEVAVGFGDMHQRRDATYFGAVIGRCANRIAKGRATIAGVEHQFPRNEGDNTLHGGTTGFDARMWQVREHTPDTISLELVSPDGDQGFPGTLTVHATYRLLDDGLRLDLDATTDRETLCMLTSHAYWNLAGDGSITDHLVSIDADEYAPIGDDSIPLGHLDPVAGTPLDLRHRVRLGDRMDADHVQVARAGGVDHSFQLRGHGLRRAARVEEPTTGRVLEVFTDQPALQVYTGNALDGTLTAANGHRLRRGDALALEAQHHPDGPHQPWRDGVVLRPGEQFASRIEWHFPRR